MRGSQTSEQSVSPSSELVGAQKKTKKAAPEPLRYKLGEAAALLNVHYETLRDLITKGVFTVIAPKGRGVGKHIYLHPDEVKTYATDGEDAVRELRVRTKRVKPRK